MGGKGRGGWMERIMKDQAWIVEKTGNFGS